MNGWRRDYDERLPAILDAVRSMPGDISNVIPGMTRAGLERFFKRFSVLLGRLDRSIKHPERMILDGQSAVDVLFNNIDPAISHMHSSSAAFVQGFFSLLVRVQDALTDAAGTDASAVQKLSSSVAADLGAAVSNVDALTARATQSARKIEELDQEARARRAELSSLLEQVRADAARAAEVRSTVEQLVRPDGRSRSSLEALARQARNRISEIDETLASAKKTADDVDAQAQSAQAARAKAESDLESLRELKIEAETILNLSAQAGLAASYKNESKRLSDQSLYFTIGLYSASAITLILAACYIIPELNKALLAMKGQQNFWQALTFTLLRASVIAPLIYVIYFTTKRISALEMLRMDYAEKAAASLAYSGYRDQMDADEELLRQLKASLLLKFSEHPERLLRPGQSITKASVTTPGFKGETEFRNDSGAKRNADSDTDAE